MSKEQERKFAKKTGWSRLGVLETDVRTDYNAAERLALGMEQAVASVKARNLKDEMKVRNKELNEQVKHERAVAWDRALALSRGYRINRVPLPCFLDPKKKERVFMDLSTGVEAHREPMLPEDNQLILDVEE